MRQVQVLVLALALQLAPLCRVAAPSQVLPAAGFAIVFRCLLGTAALLGSYDAVSAASAVIAGVANTSPAGPVTINATGNVGQPFSYRIVVNNPGKDHAQDFWNAAPLPPGLTINTNIGGDGKIIGVPTVSGLFRVTLTAGNINSDFLINKNIIITIQGPPDTPAPTQIVLAGQTVFLTAERATGENLKYQWQFNGTNLPGATGPTLTLTNLMTSQSGVYSVVVSNSLGSKVSPNARILVVPPTLLSLRSRAGGAGGVGQLTLSFVRTTGFRYSVQSSETLRSGSWVELTNFPPANADSQTDLLQSFGVPRTRFYRVQVTAN